MLPLAVWLLLGEICPRLPLNSCSRDGPRDLQPFVEGVVARIPFRRQQKPLALRWRSALNVFLPPICPWPSEQFIQYLEAQKTPPSFSVKPLSPFNHHAVPPAQGIPSLPFLVNLEEQADGRSQAGTVTGVPPPKHIDLEWDYASKEAGARVAEQSPELRNVRALQVRDRDSYMITKCTPPLYFVLQLPEAVFLRAMSLETRESFTDTFQHVLVLGSNDFPTEEWRLLATLRTNPTAEREIFNIENECKHKKKPSCWVRFVKIAFMDTYHKGDYHYCTLTRLQLFGSDILQKLDSRITNSSSPSLTREKDPKVQREEADGMYSQTQDVWLDTLKTVVRRFPELAGLLQQTPPQTVETPVLTVEDTPSCSVQPSADVPGEPSLLAMVDKVDRAHQMLGKLSATVSAIESRLSKLDTTMRLVDREVKLKLTGVIDGLQQDLKEVQDAVFVESDAVPSRSSLLSRQLDVICDLASRSPPSMNGEATFLYRKLQHACGSFSELHPNWKQAIGSFFSRFGSGLPEGRSDDNTITVDMTQPSSLLVVLLWFVVILSVIVVPRLCKADGRQISETLEPVCEISETEPKPEILEPEPKVEISEPKREISETEPKPEIFEPKSEPDSETELKPEISEPKPVA
ncbi:MAG: hypothetical protein KVP17_005135 [Porospora cf. gigantea B]|uniref:uncharacterized protein n=1 Tax=Porospora cf. gigantea B TaxID=2853592 RepID=UPI003571BC94|nr:MAG: hypothetical protein KVP17_005135 [Porospora cf. gigantea B]